MTEIKSDKKEINYSDKNVFDFFSDLRNLEKIMPDRVVDWKAEENNCYFTIKGTASLGMEKAYEEEYSKIVMKNFGKVPFEFSFIVNIDSNSENSSIVDLSLNADLNAFLKMAAVKPLTNFLNMLLDSLKIQKLD